MELRWATSKPKKIAFCLTTGFASRPLDASNLFSDSRGLTGSEISLFMYASELAKKDYDVTIFSNFGVEGEWEGCSCVNIDKEWPKRFGERWDVVLAWMDPTPLRILNGPLRIFNQQVNDFNYCPWWKECTDVITSPSASHRDHFRSSNDFAKWEVLPNGCDSSQYSDNKIPGRMIWASSPDRGLHWLLMIWPEIKRQVPHANLRIFYDMPHSGHLPEITNRFEYVREAVRRLEGKDVFHVKSVSRKRMAEEMSQAEVFPYTCDTIGFTEGFSVTTLEACASGTVPIITDKDALGSIYGKSVPTVKSPVGENLDKFIELVVKALTNPRFRMEVTNRAQSFAKNYEWSVLSSSLEDIMNKRISP